MATIDSVEGGSIPLNELQVRCEVDDGGRRSIHTLALQTEAEDGKSQANCSQLISTSHTCSWGISNSRTQSEPEVNGVESDERVGQQPRLLAQHDRSIVIKPPTVRDARVNINSTTGSQVI